VIDKFKGFQRLPGSELHLSPSLKLLGPADPNEAVKLTIILRRRLDGSPMPGPEYFGQGTPLAQRQRIPRDEFATRYGASPTDLSLVVDFARTHGLRVTNADAASRSVDVVGRVAQMEKAFTVKLRYYQRQQTADDPIENYCSYEGFIHIPDHLLEIVIGVFGLDNRDITKRHRFASIRAGSPDSDSSDSDPPDTKAVTVSDIRGLYNFPMDSAAGQTIAI
jgi:kumamolisin